MIFDYLLSIIIKSITSPNITQFSSHTPESPSKLNSLWWSVLLSSQKWKISFAPRNLFNSRINNRALLLQRLLFIFCSCWRRLLLKDQLFICLFVESLLLLSLSIFPIIIFFVTVVAMITIFISSSFISPSLVLLLVVFLFFFSFFFFFFSFWFKRSNVSRVVTLLVDSQPLSVFCHMGNFGCGDGGWTPVMKIDGRKVHTFVK